MQNLRGVPSIDKAYEYLYNEVKLLNIKVSPKPIMLNTDKSFDLINKSYSSEYLKLDHKKFIRYQK